MRYLVVTQLERKAIVPYNPANARIVLELIPKDLYRIATKDVKFWRLKLLLSVPTLIILGKVSYLSFLSYNAALQDLLV